MRTGDRMLMGIAGGMLLSMVPALAVQAGREAPYYHIDMNGGVFEQDASGTYHYFIDGEMMADAFFCDGTYTYYLESDGSPMTDRLTYHPDGEADHIIYFDAEGHEVFDNFANVKKSIAGEPVDDLCFFNSLGFLYVDELTYGSEKYGTETELYYANPYGVMECDGWFLFSGEVNTPWGNNDGVAGQYGYANADGTLMKDRYTWDWNGNPVYMEADGHMRAVDETAEPILRRETDHFQFYCTIQDTSALDDLSKALENCYDRVTSDLGKAPADKTKVNIYPDLDSYHQAVGRPNAPDWSIGTAMNGAVYMASPLNPGPAHHYDDILVNAVHEYVHIVVGQFERRPPTYLNEGIACYEAGQFGNMIYYIPIERANGTMPSLDALETSRDSHVYYTYGPAYVDFVVKSFGFDKIISLLEGNSEAEVFGMSREELNKKWMDYLMSY